MTDLYAGAGSTTNWSGLGGGASALNAETDYFIQGSGCTTKNAFASTRKGMIFDCVTDRASLVGTDGAFLMWTTQATPNSLDTIANGGITMVIGSGTGDYKHWYVGGSDTIEFMGWILAAVNPSEATDEADAGSPTAVEDHIGVLFDLPSGGPTKGAPNAVDAIRAGRCDLIYTLGTGADPDASFALAVANRGGVTDRLGLVQLVNGSYFCSGLHQLGDSTNLVNFSDDNKTLFWRDHPAVTAPFNTLEIQNASSVVSMTSLVWKALGTKSPGTWVTTDNATVGVTSCSFIDWGAFGFASNTTILSTTFVACGVVTQNSAALTSCVFDACSTLLSNNPALLTGNSFTSAGTGHAIEITTAGTYTFTGNTYSGYGAGGTTNATIYNNSGGSVTLNIVGGDTPTIRNGAGASTTVNNSVNVSFDNIVSGSALVITATATVGTVTSGDILVNQVVTTDPFTYSHNYEGNLTFSFKILKGTSSPVYKPLEGSGTISSTGFSFTANQVGD